MLHSAHFTRLKPIPMPVVVQSTGGTFSLSATSSVVIEPKTAETTAIADYLVSKLTVSTGYKLPILESTGSPASGNIYLTTLNADPTLGDEGCNSAITSNLITLSAYNPPGHFRDRTIGSYCQSISKRPMYNPVRGGSQRER